MRKVFLVLMVLSLSSMFISCSDSEDAVTPTPTPEPSTLEISTSATLNTGHACSPYFMQMEATGGTEPYTWALATGSVLPAGLELSADGLITGMRESTGSYNFTIVCTDSESDTDESAFSLAFASPDVPSIAIYFDEGASLYSGDITYPATLDCYAFIILDGSTYEYAQGASFKVNLLNEKGEALESGVDYFLTSTVYPTYPNFLSMGHPSTGLAEVFSRQGHTEPIMLCKFSLMLLENLDHQLAFEIVPNPDEPVATARPIILDGDNVEREVPGRMAAINF